MAKQIKEIIVLVAILLAQTTAAAEPLKGGIDYVHGYSSRVPPGHIGVHISQKGFIGHVYRNSPAEEIGLKAGDVVTEVDGKPNNINAIIGEPGTLVLIRYRRNKSETAIVVRRVDARQIQKEEKDDRRRGPDYQRPTLVQSLRRRLHVAAIPTSGSLPDTEQDK